MSGGEEHELNYRGDAHREAHQNALEPQFGGTIRDGFSALQDTQQPPRGPDDSPSHVLEAPPIRPLESWDAALRREIEDLQRGYEILEERIRAFEQSVANIVAIVAAELASDPIKRGPAL